MKHDINIELPKELKEGMDRLMETLEERRAKKERIKEHFQKHGHTYAMVALSSITMYSAGYKRGMKAVLETPIKILGDE